MLLYSKNPEKNYKICVRASLLLLVVSLFIGLLLQKKHGIKAAVTAVLFINLFNLIELFLARKVLKKPDEQKIERAWKTGQIYRYVCYTGSGILFWLILGWKWMLVFVTMVILRFILVKWRSSRAVS